MKIFGFGVARICIGLVLILCSACSSSRPSPQQETRAWNSATASRDLFVQANEVRAAKGLHGLRWSGDLAALAQDHAQKMAAKNRLSHGGFQRRFDHLVKRGLVTKLTENVAMSKGYADPVGTTIRGWIDSPGHRRNLYDRDVAVTGVGFAISRDGKIYFTQIYGR